MSWSGHGSIYLKREKLNRVMERSQKLDQTFPALAEFFSSSQSLEEEFATDLVDKITFSKYPGSQISGSAALRAFVTSEKNLPVLKTNGTIGALVNVLLRVDIQCEGTSKHVENAIQSLHVLLNDDIVVQQRLLANPHIVPIILKLNQYTLEDTQSKAFDILEWLSLLENGLNFLLEKGLVDVLFRSELLHSTKATTRVKHGAVDMILKIATMDPMKISPTVIENALFRLNTSNIPSDGFMDHAAVDSYMEQSLLDSLMLHLKACDRSDIAELGQYILLPFLIKTILDEKFENLDQVHQIVHIISWYSKSLYHSDFLLRNDILAMLQYLVHTDFNIFRRRQNKDPVALATSLKKQIKSKSLFADKRSLPTLMALAIVKPQSSAALKTTDVNFSITISAITIYENLVNVKPDVVGSIISSGFIPALLFRVGSGPDLDVRMNIAAVKFLEKVLLKVCLSQPRFGRKISLIGTLPKPKIYIRLPKIESAVGNEGARGIDYTTGSVKDIALITRTVRAQGVVALFIQSLRRTEHQELIRQSLLGLSYLHFPAIASDIYGPENISRICHLTKTKQECYFCGLALVCDSILYLDVSLENINEIIQCHAIEMLCKALHLSSWMFFMKDTVYRALSKLTQHPEFYSILVRINEVPIVCYEMTIRKRSDSRKNRRARLVAGEDDDGTEALFFVLRQDWAATRIQSIVRRSSSAAATHFRRQTKFAHAEIRAKEIAEHAAAKDNSKRIKKKL